MDSQFISPISVEKFAAYLDGNLPEAEMQEIELVISHNDNLEDLVLMSDVIDEDIQIYLQDDFAYDADMSMLEESDFEIPQLDIVGEELPLVACAMDFDNGYDDILDVAADSENMEAKQPFDISEENNVTDFERMNLDQENTQSDDVIDSDENHMDIQDMNFFHHLSDR